MGTSAILERASAPCPSATPTRAPVATSYTRAVPSSDAVTSHLAPPPSWNATSLTSAPSCARICRTHGATLSDTSDQSNSLTPPSPDAVPTSFSSDALNATAYSPASWPTSVAIGA